MDGRLLIKILGGLSVALGVILLVPACFSLFDGDTHTITLTLCSVATISLGALAWFSCARYNADLNNRTSFALVTFSWMSACVIGAIPFYTTGTVSSFVDALFESVSGFTGTGATVIANVEGADRAVLLWRSMTQWLGGMGIILFFVAVLPTLGVGGVQLFRAEVAGPQKDRITPRVRETARKLWILYLSFTLLLAFFLSQAGMSVFDAVNHAFTTLATGGFSTKNSGIAWFNRAEIDYILTIFMIVGSISFSLHYRFIVQRDARAIVDTELKWYAGIVVGATIVMTYFLHHNIYASLKESFRHGLFVVASIISSTGFSNHDYVNWPPITNFIIVLLMVMGGMSGSTAGGVKCIRLVAAFKQLIKQLIQTIHPSAILTIKANDHSIPEHVIDAIWGLLFLYFLAFSVGAAVLCIQGYDLLTASTATFSALSNIGPALGQLGPTTHFGDLPSLSKLTLTACMLLGRLEFFTILVVFTIAFWKK